MPRRWMLLLLVPPILAMLAYSRVVTLKFVNIDDPPYVTENPHIRDGWTFEAVHWALTSDLVEPSINTDYWQPVTALSRILDVSLYGFDPRGHHLMNLLLHAANAFLLGYFLVRATGRILPGVLAGALFAVHPLHVSSVAWVTERKDMLGLFFLLASLLAFSAYLKAPSRGRLAAVIVAYALSLMSKPLGLTLPLLLPFLAVWPLGVISTPDDREPPDDPVHDHPAAHGKTFRARSWSGTLPVHAVIRVAALMLVLAAISMGITMHGQPHAFEYVDRWRQMSNAIVTIGVYLFRAALPVGLAIPYPFPLEPIPASRIALAAVVTIAATGSAFVLRKRAPFLLTGWMWYLLTILPTLGLVHEASANRFTYFPMIGIYIIAAWTFETLGDHSSVSVRRWLVAGAAVWILVLAGATYREVVWWRDSQTLFTRAIEVTGPNHLAERNLGVATGDAEIALRHFDRSIALFSRDAAVYHYRGTVLERLGRETEAIEAYSNALHVNPDYLPAQYNRAILLTKFSRKTEAESDYLHLLLIDPDDVYARNNLGSLYYSQARYSEALEQYWKAHLLSPKDSVMLCNLGSTLFKLGSIPESTDCFERVLKADPSNAFARRSLEMIRNVPIDTADKSKMRKPK